MNCPPAIRSVEGTERVYGGEGGDKGNNTIFAAEAIEFTGRTDHTNVKPRPVPSWELLASSVRLSQKPSVCKPFTTTSGGKGETGGNTEMQTAGVDKKPFGTAETTPGLRNRVDSGSLELQSTVENASSVNMKSVRGRSSDDESREVPKDSKMDVALDQ